MSVSFITILFILIIIIIRGPAAAADDHLLLAVTDFLDPMHSPLFSSVGLSVPP